MLHYISISYHPHLQSCYSIHCALQWASLNEPQIHKKSEVVYM